MTLWLTIALITAPFLWLLFRPLLSSVDDGAPERKDLDIGVYRDQLDEVERDLARGVLDRSQADAARLEIQRRMLKADKEASEASRHLGPGAIRSIGGVTAGVMVLGALGLYLELGEPTRPDLPLADRAAEIAADRQARASAGGFEAAVRRLTQRLLDEPNDPDGWALLGSSLIRMARYPEAADAFARASSLVPENTELLAMRAEALIFAAEGQVTDVARELIARVLEQNPGDPRAGFYVGLSRAQAGEPEEALKIWLTMLSEAPQGATWINMVRSRIDQLAAEEGIDISAYIAALPEQSAPVVAPTAPGPSREDMEAAAELSEEERNEMILGMMSRLADKLRENPQDLGGWERLLKSYMVMNQPTQAATALNEAVTLNQANPTLVAQLQTLGKELGINP